MMKDFGSAKEINPVDHTKSILYVGPPGSGKSTAASTSPEPGFLFDMGREALSYKGKDIDYYTIPHNSKGWMKAEMILNNFLKNSTKDVAVYVDKESGETKEYKTVILDNLTSAGEIALVRAMDINPNRDDAGGPIGNVHFRMAVSILEGFLRKFMELPCLRVATCHVEYTKDEISGEMLVQPLLGGRLQARIPGNFDEVLYTVPMNTETGPKFFLQTVTLGKYRARSRIRGVDGTLPDYIPNDYSYLIGEKSYSGPTPKARVISQDKADKK